jgi:hypothetical protein
MIYINYCLLTAVQVLENDEVDRRAMGVCDLADGMAGWRCKHSSLCHDRTKCIYLNIQKIGEGEFISQCMNKKALLEVIEEIEWLTLVAEQLQRG